ncbi:hypothetical protein B9Z55_025403 [Caenorhabditis nigoni]|uniref:Uncharacterized protein n=1 Tax=Caenorhabditis nigoni TaxID=1611254 RepID=A0A2G5SZ17_9PELO|nr:hypothetical protein B9Z55_025403 [Caenorhabditis nigoni]
MGAVRCFLFRQGTTKSVSTSSSSLLKQQRSQWQRNVRKSDSNEQSKFFRLRSTFTSPSRIVLVVRRIRFNI